MWVGLAVVFLSLAGCRQVFGLDGPALTPDASVAPDAGPCMDVSEECASTDLLRTCMAVGATPIDTVCAWGCLAGGTPRCGVLQPAGGIISATSLSTSPRLDDITLGTATTIHTDTGEITGVRPAGTGVLNGIAFSLKATGGVFELGSLTINANLAIVGTRAAVLAAQQDVTIAAQIDVRGTCIGQAAGPGGFAGGAAEATGMGPGGGSSGGIDPDLGGGGGGHAGIGGRGGTGGTGVGVLGGPIYGDEAIMQLRGGSGGGGGGDATESAGGGGGGGALQIIANGGSLAILGTGVINAGGCGGEGAPNNGSGGGGGAGGTILLEAPTVSIAGTLAVNGGGGGGGNNVALAGADGLPSRAAALGGMGAGAGGDGGNGASAASPTGSAGGVGNHGGGGGGALGRIRLNTRTGSATLIGSVMSPSVTDPRPATQGVATIQ